LRGFRQDIVTVLGLQTTGMEFASEMVVKATLFKLKIAEVPTTLAPDGRSRPPHLRTWRDGWRHLRFLLIYSPRWLYTVPGMALMVLGLVIGAAIVHGPKRVFGVTLDTNTLIYSGTAVVIGFQMVVFGVFARVHGMMVGFLPRKQTLEWTTQHGVLERGLIGGVLVFVLGLVGAFVAVSRWGHAGFARLVYPDILRIVIPSAVAMMLGVQIAMAAFFLSVLMIHRK
jgi:hypothetical protein